MIWSVAELIDMIFHGHLQSRADDCLVALELPNIDVRGTVQLIDSAGVLDEHPAFKVPLDSSACGCLWMGFWWTW
ncbi:hypothetical protein SBA4_2310051 [Candidatus Sulfopaludibacter sp. SbA4]|nr:hypothetical protein SBA4_2310051 [Candidatus Sulfopaludibacter sp. SbA4]